MDNFKFFALAYLNDWWQYDRNFVAGLYPGQSRESRLYWLKEAATYYQVGRRFPEKQDGPERLGKVLDLLDAVLKDVAALTQQNVDQAVYTLAEKFNEAYGNGVDETTSQTMRARHVYSWETFRFNHRYKDISSNDSQMTSHLDFSMFDEIEAEAIASEKP